MASRRRGIDPEAANPFAASGGRQDMTVQDADELLFGNMDPTVLIAQLRLDGGTQPRASLDEDTIQEYTEAMQRGDRFPPVVVFYDGVDHWLADGFHRVMAAQRAGLDKVRADIKQGTRRDAVLHSVGVNAQHGLRRSNADKRRAVETLLADAEWAGWSDREIAKRCKVSHELVGRLRQSSLAESASENGAHEKKERTYTTKHGTPAKMKVGGIQQANQTRAVEPEPVGQFEDNSEDCMERILSLLATYGELDPAHLRQTSGLDPDGFNQVIDTMLAQGQIERVQDANTGRIVFRSTAGPQGPNPNPGNEALTGEQALRADVLRHLRKAAKALNQLGEADDAQELLRYTNSLAAEWKLEE